MDLAHSNRTLHHFDNMEAIGGSPTLDRLRLLITLPHCPDDMPIIRLDDDTKLMYAPGTDLVRYAGYNIETITYYSRILKYPSHCHLQELCLPLPPTNLLQLSEDGNRSPSLLNPNDGSNSSTSFGFSPFNREYSCITHQSIATACSTFLEHHLYYKSNAELELSQARSHPSSSKPNRQSNPTHVFGSELLLLQSTSKYTSKKSSYNKTTRNSLIDFDVSDAKKSLS